MSAPLGAANPSIWRSLFFTYRTSAAQCWSELRQIRPAFSTGQWEVLRQLAAELKVPLVDVRAAYPEYAARQKTEPDGLLLDGMHPNDKGHSLVAERLLPVIRELLR